MSCSLLTLLTTRRPIPPPPSPPRIPKANEADCLSWPCGCWPGSRPQATGGGATSQSPTRHTGHCPSVNSPWAPQLGSWPAPTLLAAFHCVGPSQLGAQGSQLMTSPPTRSPSSPPSSYNCSSPSCCCHSLDIGIRGSQRLRQLRAWRPAWGWTGRTAWYVAFPLPPALLGLAFPLINGCLRLSGNLQSQALSLSLSVAPPPAPPGLQRNRARSQSL